MVAMVSGNGFGLFNGSAGVLGQQGLFGNATLGTAKEGAYVNVFNGNLTLQNTDDFLASRGINVAFTRTYNAQGTFNDGNGANWLTGVARLTALPASPNTAGSTVTRVAADGSTSIFTYDASRNAYVSTDGAGAYQTLTYAGGQWTWKSGQTGSNGLYETYDQTTGRLSATGDQLGIRTKYYYNPAGRLAQVTDSTGSTGKAGAQTSNTVNDQTYFDYDASGKLTQIRQVLASSGGTTVRTHYEYDTQNRLSRVVTDLTPADAKILDNNVYAVSYTYDGTSNRIASVAQSDGTQLLFEYDEDGWVKKFTERGANLVDRVTTLAHTTLEDGTRQTAVTDGLNHTTTYYTDAQGQLVRVESPSQSIAFGYNAKGDVISTTDTLGRVTTFEYDTNGNCIRQTDPAGNVVERTYSTANPAAPTTDPGNRLLTETVIAAGANRATHSQTTRYVYEADAGLTARLRFIISPQGRVTEYTYDALGQRSSEWTFNASAYNVAALAPETVPTEAQLVAWIATSAVDKAQITRTDYVYNIRGQVATSTTYATATTTSTTATNAVVKNFTYDAAGNLLTVSGTATVGTTYTYDGLGRTLTKVDPNGTTTFTYLANSTTARSVDPSGLTTDKVYDAAGRLVSATQWEGALTSTARNLYDAAGRLRMTVDAAGRKTVLLYDDAGRKVAEVGPDGAVTEYIYDAGNQPVNTIRYLTPIAQSALLTGDTPRDDVTLAAIRPAATAFDRKTYAQYDALGRLVATVDAERYLTRYVYDVNGHLVSTIQRARQLSAAQLAAGIPAQATAEASAEDRITRTLYNADGLLVAKLDALGYLTENIYDVGGRLVDTIAYATATAPSARAAGDLATLRPTTSTEDIRNHFVYDGAGRLLASVDGDNYVTEVVYDANGNVQSRIRYANPSTSPYGTTLATVKTGTSASNADNRITSYTYNTLRQVVTESTTNSGGTVIGTSITYTYDKQGNVTSVARTNGSTRVSRYDDLGRLIAEAPAAGMPETTYAYDAANRRVSMTDANGNRTLYFYDAAGRLTHTVNALGEVASKTYDAFGQVIAERRYMARIGVTNLKGGDAADLNAFLLPGTTDPRTFYYYDKDGRLVYTVSGEGDVAAQTYDAFGGTVAATRYTARISGAVLATLTGGVPTSLLLADLAGKAGQTTRYGYDADGRLTYTINPLADVQSRGYDAFGNVVETVLHAQRDVTAPVRNAQDSVTATTYDKRGNAITYTDAAGYTTTTAYNAFGQVASVKSAGTFVNGTTTVVDTITRTLYDNDGRVIATIDGTGAVTVLTYDGNGNVTERVSYANPLTPANAAAATSATVKSLAANVANAELDRRQRYFYDAAGRLTATVTAAESSTWAVQTITYDAYGNVVERRAFATRMSATTPTAASIATWAATASSQSASDEVRRTIYDEAGRVAGTAALLRPGAWSVEAVRYDMYGRVQQRIAYATPFDSVPSALTLRATFVGVNDAVTQYQYDRAGHVIATATAQYRDDAGMHWSLVENRYDGAGNVIATVQYAKDVIASTLPNDLLSIAAAGAEDRVTRYEYDAAGRLSRTIDATGAVTGIVYDAKGRAVQKTLYAKPDGSVPVTDPADRTIRTVYDQNGRARFVIDPLGAVTESRYDALGNVTATVQYAATIDAARITPESTVGHVTALLAANAQNDRTQRFVYDQAGRLRFSVDPAGYFVEHRYDALGRETQTLSYVTPVSATDAVLASALLGAVTAQATTVRSVTQNYDSLGRVIRLTDALKRTESYGYDALGRRTTLTSKTGAVWKYAYDAAGRLVREESPSVATYSTTGITSSDAAATLAAVTTTLIKTYTYDALGNLVARGEGTGTPTDKLLTVTRYAYDLAGRQTRTILPATAVYNGDAPALTVEAPTITVTYNMFGEAVSNTDVGGNVSYKVYDKAGRVAYDVDALGYVTRYGRDAFGDARALTRYADAMKDIDTSSTVTMAAALKAAAANPLNRTINTDYDRLGRAVRVTEPAVWINDTHALSGSAGTTAARTTDTVYNAFGEVEQRSVYGAAGGVAVTETAITRYYYDQRGGKRGQIDVLNNGTPKLAYATVFNYDEAGRLLDTTEFANTTSTWNDRNSLWNTGSFTAPAASDADRKTIYTYDAVGNKLSERRTGYKTDGTTRFTYDKLDRLQTTTDTERAITAIWYDAAGRTVATGQQAPDSGTPKMPYSVFRLDALGNVVVKIDYANGAPATLSPDAAAPVVTASKLDRVTTTLYDANSRAIQVIDAENKSAYYAYDVFGRVAKQWRTVTNPGASTGEATSYVAFQINRYDALGRLVDVTQPGNTNLIDGGTPPDTQQHSVFNAFGELTGRTISGGGKVLRTEETRYDNAGRAWLSNAGDGVYRVTLFDARGNATATVVGTGETLLGQQPALSTLGKAEDVLGRYDVRITDTRYDMLGHVVDVGTPHANQLYFLHRAADGSWEQALYNPATKELDGLVVLGDRADLSSTYTVRYRLRGTTQWQESLLRVQRIDGIPVFNTGGLAQGDYEFRVTVKPATGAAYEVDGGTLSIAAQPGEQKAAQLIQLYLALFNRAPDPQGLDYFLGKLSDGFTFPQVALEIINSKEFKDKFGTAATDAVPGTTALTYVLKDVLGMAPGAAFDAELQKWLAKFTAQPYGADNRGLVLVDLITEKQAALAARVQILQEYMIKGGGSDPVFAAQLLKDAAVDMTGAVAAAARHAADEKRDLQVARLYAAIFGRAADSTGFAFWRDALVAGAVDAPALAAKLLASPEFLALQPAAGLSTAQFNEQLVKRVYSGLLARLPSAAELTAAVNAIGSDAAARGAWIVRFTDRVAGYAGTDATAVADRKTAFTRVTISLAYAQMPPVSADLQTQIAVGQALLAGTVADANINVVADKVLLRIKTQQQATAAYASAAQLAAASLPLENLQLQLARVYATMLGRAPDRTGYGFWLNALLTNPGTTLETIAGEMLTHEGAALYPATLSDAQFVAQVYAQAFGAKIDTETQNTWVAKLAGNSRAKVALDLVNGALSGTVPVTQANRSYFNNKVAVGISYALYMDGDDPAIARQMFAKVTSTDVTAALDVAYQPTAALAAAAAAANAAATQKGAKLVGDAAVAALALLNNTLSAADLSAALAGNPFAKPLLTAARLYVAILRRGTVDDATGVRYPDLDVAGLLNMAKQLQSGTTDGAMVQAMLDSSEGQGLFPASLTPEGFVRQVYAQVLHRTPDPEGLRFWTNALSAAPAKRGEIAVGILNGFLDKQLANDSPYAMDNQKGLQRFNTDVGNALNAIAAKAAAVTADASAVLNAANDAKATADAFASATSAVTQAVSSASSTNAALTLTLARLYVGILNRNTPNTLALDFDGMTFWLRALKSGDVTPASIAQQFIDSTEGRKIFGNLTDPRAFVNQVYLQALGRPLAADETHWINELNSGRTRGQVAWDIIDSLINYTYQLPSEYNAKAQFDQRVGDAIRVFNNASTTAAGITAAAGDENTKYTELSTASSTMQTRKNEWDATLRLVATDDPNVIAAQGGKNFYNSSNRDTLQELLVGFGRGTSYSAVAAMLADLDAGRTTITALVGQWVGSMSDKTAFFTRLYTTILQRTPDADGLKWWVDNTTSTDAGYVAYEFFKGCKVELYGAQTSYRKRNNFAGEVSTVTSSNNATAKRLADGYNAALQTANSTIASKQSAAKTAYDNAVTAYNNANVAYQNAASYNAIAKNTRAALSAVLTIQDKAVIADRAGSAKLTAEANARTVISRWNPDAVNWSIAQLNAALAPTVNSAAAVVPDANYSATLAGIAGANLALLANARDTAAADQTTRNIVQVAQLYTVLFGPSRQPTLLELNTALLQLRDGATLATVADSLIARQPTLSGSLNTAYVDQLYRNAMARGADADGLAFWLNTMSGAQPFSRGQVAAGLINSLVIGTLNKDTAKFDDAVAKSLTAIASQAQSAAASPDTAAFINALVLALRDETTRADAAAQVALTPEARAAIEVTQLYVVLLGRAPEPSALVSAVLLRQQGLPLAELAQSILASDEIQATLPSTLDNAAFVETLLRGVFGRNPTSGEVAAYAGKLAGGTRAQLVLDAIADVYGYNGPNVALETSRTQLMGRVNTALDSAATALRSYATALSGQFVDTLTASLKAAAMRYVDGYRTVLDSTATDARYVHSGTDRMTVDRWGNTLSVADVRNPNWKTTYTYDANNQVIEMAVPATSGGTLVTTNQYDATGRLLIKTETGTGYAARVTKYAYNAQGVMVRETHADGGYTVYDVDAFGQRVASHQYLSASKVVNYTYEYDRMGRLTARISDETAAYDWDGSRSDAGAADTLTRGRIIDRYTYDELGRRTSTSVSVRVTSTGVETAAEKSWLSYDQGGNIILAVDAGNRRTVRAYDALNNKISERETALQGAAVLTQSWSYDGFGRVTSHTDLAGGVTSSWYNEAGQLHFTSRFANTQQGARFADVTYRYDLGSGQLAEAKSVQYTYAGDQRVLDATAGVNQLVRYSYDRAGNRVTEQTWLLSAAALPLKLVQDQVQSYDERGQLIAIKSSIPGADYDVRYVLDSFGNRKDVTTTYRDDYDNKKTITVHYQYDAMNRATNISGDVRTDYAQPVAEPRPVARISDEQPTWDEVPVYWKDFDNKAIATHAITYDWAGNRLTDNTERYTYDELGRLSTITNGSVTGYRHYDKAGRVIASKQGDELQLNDYDASGRIAYQRTFAASNNALRSRVEYSYDTVGNLAQYKVWSGTNSKAQVTTNTYDELRDSRLLTSTVVQNEGSSDRKASGMQYDVNGAMVAVTGENARTLLNDLEGRVLVKNQAGVVTRSLIANGQMIGNASVAYESFSSVHETVSAASSGSGGTGVYVVQRDGETLTGIAKALWGDERMWYLIADANGLTTSTEGLKVGQSLIVPAKASTVYNGADTFKPYNASEVIGSTTPELAMPVPAQKKGGCGGLGQLVMIVVAVVATIYTAGAAAGMMGATAGTAAGTAAGTGLAAAGSAVGAAGAAGMTATFSAGLSALGGSLGFSAGLVAGAVGGAVGSIASQAVGIAIGAQDSFSWKGVAMGALGGGVSGGVAGALGQAASIGGAMGRAALGNVVSQGVNIATGLQNGFEWRNVAASAAGAGASYAMSGALQQMKLPDLVTQTVSGIAGGTVAAVVRGGKVDFTRIATDAFGNALGNSIATRAGTFSQEQLADIAHQERQAIARDGTDYFAARYVEAGMGVMEATVRSRSDELRDYVGVVQAMASAENDAGVRFDAMSVEQQTNILRTALAENSRSGALLTTRMSQQDNAVAVMAEAGYPGAVRLPDAAPVTVTGVANVQDRFVRTAANVLDRTNAAMANVIEAIGPTKAEFAIFGLQAAIGGIPRTVLSYAGDYVLGGIKQDLGSKLGDVIADRAFDVESASPERAKDIRTVSNALGNYGVDVAFSGARTLIGSVLNSRTVLNSVGSAALQVRGPYRGGPHSSTRLPVGDGLDSHHLPADSISPIPRGEGPAIQMDPRDHRATSSNGGGLDAIEYREMIRDMIDSGRMRDAMATEVRDVRRAAHEVSGDRTKYNEALREMLKYSKDFGILDKGSR